jgi:hypothetical protein
VRRANSSTCMATSMSGLRSSSLPAAAYARSLLPEAKSRSIARSRSDWSSASVATAGRQEFPHPRQRSKLNRPNSCWLPAKGARDLVVRHLLEEPEKHDLLLFGRELNQSRLDQFTVVGLVTRQTRLARVLAFWHGSQVKLLSMRVEGRNRAVARDRENPRGDGGVAAVPRPSSPRAKERFACCVFGQLRVAHQTARVAQDGLERLAINGCKPLLVTSLELADGNGGVRDRDADGWEEGSDLRHSTSMTVAVTLWLRAIHQAKAL